MSVGADFGVSLVRRTGGRGQMGICKHSTDDDNEWEGGPKLFWFAGDAGRRRIIRQNRRLRQRFSARTTNRFRRTDSTRRVSVRNTEPVWGRYFVLRHCWV